MAGGGGVTFAAMDEGSEHQGSHEQAGDQGWVSWIISGIKSGLRKADQLGGAGGVARSDGQCKDGRLRKPRGNPSPGQSRRLAGRGEHA